MNGRFSVAASLAILSFAGNAAAQQAWLSDRRYGEGIGIKTGNFELHPSLAAEFGYDSNYYQRAEGEFGGVIDAWRLRITPSISLSTLSSRRAGSEAVGAPPMLTFDANAFFAYSEIFGEGIEPPRSFNAGAGANAEIAPQRPFGGDLNVNYLRSGEPSNLPGADQAFDRSTTDAGVGVSWRPGGGLLDWRLGYAFQYNQFEENAYDELNNFQHSIETRGRWRFLPRTALRYDAKYTMIRYQVNEIQPDGEYVEARVGLAGLLTSQLAFLAMVGWTASFYEGPASAFAQNYDDFVGHGEIKWFTNPASEPDSVTTGLSSIAAGYLHDFSNSYLGSFYKRDRGYLNANYFLGGVFLTSLEVGFARLNFPTISDEVGSFAQNRIDAELFAEYRLSDTFGVNLSLLYDQAFRPTGDAADGILVSGDPDNPDDDPPVYDDLRYSRFQALLGLRMFW
ncbi:MAG TPA: hypothetical protein VGK73_00315 [Polyangiaceae bacterium]